MKRSSAFDRRQFLAGSAAGGAARPSPRPASSSARPRPPSSPPTACARGRARPQIGDVSADRAIVWSRADRPARMLVEWAPSESFARCHARCAARTRSRRATSPRAIDPHRPARRRSDDLLARQLPGPRTTGKALSEPVARPLPHGARPRGATSASSGPATPPARAGASTSSLRRHEDLRDDARRATPTSSSTRGDTIYADGPIAGRGRRSPDGTVWRNLVTDPRSARSPRRWTSSAATTATTCSTPTCARFNAEVPQIWQWDDHEVTNNWSDSQGPARPTRATPRSACRC